MLPYRYLFIALIAVLATGYGLYHTSPQTSPNGLILLKSDTYIGDLVVLEGTSLFPMSYLPREMQVLSIIIIAIEEPEPWWLEPLIKCESGGNKEAIGKAGEIGWLQFMPTTFYTFAETYNLASPDIWNPEQQVWLATKMVDDGLESHWSCWKKINQ